MFLIVNLDKIINISGKSLIKYAGKKSTIRLIRAFVLGTSKFCFFVYFFFFQQLHFQKKKFITTSRKSNLFIVRLPKTAAWVFGQVQTLLCAWHSMVPLFSPAPFSILQLINFSIFLHVSLCTDAIFLVENAWWSQVAPADEPQNPHRGGRSPGTPPIPLEVPLWR